MSATIRGFQAQEVKAQPGFRPRRSENGTWSATHQFTIKRSDWANSAVRNRFAKGSAITDLDEDLDGSWSFMKVVEQEILHDEGDLIVIAVTLTGGQFAQYGDESLGESAVPTYRMSGYLQDAPLSEHHKWEPLEWKKKEALGHLINGKMTIRQKPDDAELFEYGEWVDDGEDLTFRVDGYYEDPTGDELEFAKIIAQGQTTYQRPAATWAENTQGTSRLTNGQINKLGNIATPRGNPPEPNGGRNWMLTSLFQDENGDVYSTQLEWTLSERGGHNAFLYGG